MNKQKTKTQIYCKSQRLKKLAIPKLIYLLSFALILTNCKSELQLFNQKALDFVKDLQIDKQEYQILLKDIYNSNDKRLVKQFKDKQGKIDSSKVEFYLIKLFDAKKMTSSPTF